MAIDDERATGAFVQVDSSAPGRGVRRVKERAPGDRRFEGDVVVITGAGSGMGEATARMFAQQGGRVVVFDIDARAAASTTAAIEAAGGHAVTYVGDVSKPAEVRAAIATAVRRFGRLDIMVNNSGVNTFADHTEDEASYERTMGINAKGVFFGTSYAGEQFIEQGGGGAVVNVSSVAGISVPSGAGPSYVASKHAVVGVTRVFATTLAKHGVRVNAVCPGGFRTPMNRAILDVPEVLATIGQTVPLNRWGDPDEIAAAILFLASEDASFITGVILPVDGGMSI